MMLLFLRVDGLILVASNLLIGGMTTFEKIGFHESWQKLMANGIDIREFYDVPQVENNKCFMKVKESYDRLVLGDLVYNTHQLIPKIIHQVYLAEGELPDVYKKLQATWLKYHPDWLYVLWRRSDIANFGLINQKKFDEATNHAAKGDIARYEILYRLGGLYVDLDYLCLKSFNVLHHCYDFYVGIEPRLRKNIGANRDFLIGQALIASRPGHPVLERCVQELSKKNPRGEGKWGILAATGPIFFSDCLFETMDFGLHSRSVIFPPTYFYPISAKEGSLRLDSILRLTGPETFAIHLWAGSWLGKNEAARNEDFLKLNV